MNEYLYLLHYILGCTSALYIGISISTNSEIN